MGISWLEKHASTEAQIVSHIYINLCNADGLCNKVEEKDTSNNAL